MQLEPVAAPGTVPVILLNGWQTTLSCITDGDSTIADSVGTFGQLASQLQGDGLSVAFFNNCDYGDTTIEGLAAALGTFLGSQTYTDKTPVVQFDLVTHSMGGLIARAYLSGLQENGSLQPPANDMVRKLILIASPNFGSFLAANYSLITDLGTQTSEMIPGSGFLWNAGTWNQRNDDLRGVDALAIIGNAGWWENSALLPTTKLSNASDGVVSLTSASLGFAGALYGLADQYPLRTRIVAYCHADQGFFTDIAMTCTAPSTGIANVTGLDHPTWLIVSSFLANTPDWMSIGGTPATDPYLSQYGGIMFAYGNAENQLVTDLSQAGLGDIAFQQGALANTTFYDEFIKGTGLLYVDSNSLGSFNCTPAYTAPLDHYRRCSVRLSPTLTPLVHLQTRQGGPSM